MILLGSDPEFFLEHPLPTALESRGLPGDAVGAVPAYFAMGLESPRDHLRALPYGTLTPDGAALEFTIDPSPSPAEMVERMRQNIQATRDIVAHLCGQLSANPRVYIDPRYIQALPVTYGKACSLQVLGCDPDVCAYGWDLPRKPNPKTHPYRTSGGHIHFGLGQDFVSNRALVSYFIALCDATLGAATTVLFQSEEARLRKEQYGQPGMYRVDTKRGTVEYRTMPAQAFQTPELAYMIFTKAAEIGNWAHDLYASEGANTVQIIAQRIGGLEKAFDLANNIRDHHAENCLRLMETDTMADVLSYTLPEGFMIHGW